ncbi:hypothetical protein [Asticcacaulis taihuensis]|uniref:hypothetical protein n=1 Tax=Asticcacaulis taihuensis TaxID=260084 RepID=UPI003F7BBDCB
MRALSLAEMDMVAGGETTVVTVVGQRKPDNKEAVQALANAWAMDANFAQLAGQQAGVVPIGIKDAAADVLAEFLKNYKSNANERESQYAKDGTDKSFMTAKEVHTVKDEVNGKTYVLGDGFYQTSDGRIFTDTDFDGHYDLQVKSSNGALWIDRDANGSFETNTQKMINPLDVFNT